MSPGLRRRPRRGSWDFAAWRAPTPSPAGVPLLGGTAGVTRVKALLLAALASSAAPSGPDKMAAAWERWARRAAGVSGSCSPGPSTDALGRGATGAIVHCARVSPEGNFRPSGTRRCRPSPGPPPRGWEGRCGGCWGSEQEGNSLRAWAGRRPLLTSPSPTGRGRVKPGGGSRQMRNVGGDPCPAGSGVHAPGGRWRPPLGAFPADPAVWGPRRGSWALPSRCSRLPIPSS